MDIEELASHVRAMRKAQRQYASTRRQEDATLMNAAEAVVDIALERIRNGKTLFEGDES